MRDKKNQVFYSRSWREAGNSNESYDDVNESIEDSNDDGRDDEHLVVPRAGEDDEKVDSSNTDTPKKSPESVPNFRYHILVFN